MSFVLLEVTGFWLANFAQKDTWIELTGFMLLQPVQIGLNLLDSRFKLTRGMSDRDAVLLVTLLALSLNVLLWYGVWSGWRALRRRAQKRRYAARAVRGSWTATPGAPSSPTRDSVRGPETTADPAVPEIAATNDVPLRG